MVNIDREHPEYAAKKAMWKKYRDLYAGGEQMRENAFEYLIRRHSEISLGVSFSNNLETNVDAVFSLPARTLSSPGEPRLTPSTGTGAWAGAFLHTDSGQVITSPEDGTQSARAMPCSGGSRSVGGHISGRPGLAAVAAKQRCAGQHAETGCTIRWPGSPKFRADAVAWPPKSQSQFFGSAPPSPTGHSSTVSTPRSTTSAMRFIGPVSPLRPLVMETR